MSHSLFDPGRPAGRRVVPETDREKFLELIAEGVTNSAAAAALGFGVSTMQTWVKNDPIFAEKYKKARVLGVHALVDEMIEIADRPATDMASVQHAKLQVETRKWYASKAAPRQYGDRVQADHTHTLGVVLLPALDYALPAQDHAQRGLKQISDVTDVTDAAAAAAAAAAGGGGEKHG